MSTSKSLTRPRATHTRKEMHMSGYYYAPIRAMHEEDLENAYACEPEPWVVRDAIEKSEARRRDEESRAQEFAYVDDATKYDWAASLTREERRRLITFLETSQKVHDILTRYGVPYERAAQIREGIFESMQIAYAERGEQS